MKLEEAYERHCREVEAMPEGDAKERRRKELAAESAAVAQVWEEARVLLKAPTNNATCTHLWTRLMSP